MTNLHMHLLLDQIGEVMDTSTNYIWIVCSDIKITNMDKAKTFYEKFKKF